MNKPWNKLLTEIAELKDLAKLSDQTMVDEIKQNYNQLQAQFDDIQKQQHFNGPYDDYDVIIGIYAGAGGTDAQDWAAMLLRMYQRWAESSKFKVKNLELSPGEEAGL